MLAPGVFIRYMIAAGGLHLLHAVSLHLRRAAYSAKLLFTRKGRRIEKLRQQLFSSNTYEERQAVGQVLDQIEGHDKWRDDPVSDLFDYQRVLNKTKLYEQLQADNDIEGLMIHLRAGLLRKHWGLANEELYTVSHGKSHPSQTSSLIPPPTPSWH
jgi:TAG lipase/steryl ester hydrolase/phospholipase A2/LPA acyltransferase